MPVTPPHHGLFQPTLLPAEKVNTFSIFRASGTENFGLIDQPTRASLVASGS